LLWKEDKYGEKEKQKLAMLSEKDIDQNEMKKLERFRTK
jgi:hypothetical protein